MQAEWPHGGGTNLPHRQHGRFAAVRCALVGLVATAVVLATVLHSADLHVQASRVHLDAPAGSRTARASVEARVTRRARSLHGVRLKGGRCALFGADGYVVVSATEITYTGEERARFAFDVELVEHLQAARLRRHASGATSGATLECQAELSLDLFRTGMVITHTVHHRSLLGGEVHRESAGPDLGAAEKRPRRAADAPAAGSAGVAAWLELPGSPHAARPTLKDSELALRLPAALRLELPAGLVPPGARQLLDGAAVSVGAGVAYAVGESGALIVASRANSSLEWTWDTAGGLSATLPVHLEARADVARLADAAAAEGRLWRHGVPGERALALTATGPASFVAELLGPSHALGWRRLPRGPGEDAPRPAAGRGLSAAGASEGDFSSTEVVFFDVWAVELALEARRAPGELVGAARLAQADSSAALLSVHLGAGDGAHAEEGVAHLDLRVALGAGASELLAALELNASRPTGELAVRLELSRSGDPLLLLEGSGSAEGSTIDDFSANVSGHLRVGHGAPENATGWGPASPEAAGMGAQTTTTDGSPLSTTEAPEDFQVTTEALDAAGAEQATTEALQEDSWGPDERLWAPGEAPDEADASASWPQPQIFSLAVWSSNGSAAASASVHGAHAHVTLDLAGEGPAPWFSLNATAAAEGVEALLAAAGNLGEPGGWALVSASASVEPWASGGAAELAGALGGAGALSLDARASLRDDRLDAWAAFASGAEGEVAFGTVDSTTLVLRAGRVGAALAVAVDREERALGPGAPAEAAENGSRLLPSVCEACQGYEVVAAVVSNNETIIEGNLSLLGQARLDAFDLSAAASAAGLFDGALAARSRGGDFSLTVSAEGCDGEGLSASLSGSSDALVLAGSGPLVGAGGAESGHAQLSVDIADDASYAVVEFSASLGNATLSQRLSVERLLDREGGEAQGARLRSDTRWGATFQHFDLNLHLSDESDICDSQVTSQLCTEGEAHVACQHNVTAHITQPCLALAFDNSSAASYADSEQDFVSIEIDMQMTVEHPKQFVEDVNVKEALVTAIAQVTGVSESLVSVSMGVADDNVTIHVRAVMTVPTDDSASVHDKVASEQAPLILTTSFQTSMVAAGHHESAELYSAVVTAVTPAVTAGYEPIVEVGCVMGNAVLFDDGCTQTNSLYIDHITNVKVCVADSVATAEMEFVPSASGTYTRTHGLSVQLLLRRPAAESWEVLVQDTVRPSDFTVNEVNVFGPVEFGLFEPGQHYVRATLVDRASMNDAVEGTCAVPGVARNASSSAAVVQDRHFDNVDVAFEPNSPEGASPVEFVGALAAAIACSISAAVVAGALGADSCPLCSRCRRRAVEADAEAPGGGRREAPQGPGAAAEAARCLRPVQAVRALLLFLVSLLLLGCALLLLFRRLAIGLFLIFQAVLTAALVALALRPCATPRPGRWQRPLAGRLCAALRVAGAFLPAIPSFASGLELGNAAGVLVIVLAIVHRLGSCMALVCVQVGLGIAVYAVALMPHIPGRFLLLLSATLLMLHGASSWAARTISGRSQKAAEAAAGAEGGVGAGPAEEGNDWKRYGGYVAPSPAGGEGPEGRSSAWQPGAGDGPGGEAEGARRRCLKCEV